MNDVPIYSYVVSITIPAPPSVCMLSARQAINAAHGYMWKPEGMAPEVVNDAHWRLNSTQGAVITVDVYADGSRKVRKT